MDGRELVVRNATYGLVVGLGRAPTAGEVATLTGLAAGEIVEAWRGLHDAHALVLQAGGSELRMVAPFSAVPTAYRVRAAGRWWYANCAWDALGICAALHADGRIETSCPDCGEALTVDVHDQRPGDETLLFHCLVPAAGWWVDVAFT